MSDSIAVCHVVNTFSDASFEVHLCDALSKHTEIEPTLVSLFDDPSLNEDPDFNIHRLNYEKNLVYRISDLGGEFDEYDVIHSHHNRSGAIAKLLASVLGKSNIKTEHNNHSGFHPIGKFLNGVTNPFADEVVCVSHSVKESLDCWEKAILQPDNLSVINNGVGEDVVRNKFNSDIDVRDMFSIHDGSIIITTVGMHEKQKGYDTLIKAIPIIVDNTDEKVEFILTGDGSQRENLEQLSSELNIEEFVHFTGFLPTKDDVYAVLDDTDIFVMPSRWEGHSIAALEAMAYRIPCVFSEIPSFRTTFSDVAVFHDVEDAESISNKILKLIRNPSLREKFGHLGREKVISEYTMYKTAQEHEMLYNKLID